MQLSSRRKSSPNGIRRTLHRWFNTFLSVIQHWDRKEDEMRTCSWHPAEKLPKWNKASFKSKHGLIKWGAPPNVLGQTSCPAIPQKIPKTRWRTCVTSISFGGLQGNWFALTPLGAPLIVLSHVWIWKRPYSNGRAVACLPPSPRPSPNFSDRWFNDTKAFQLYKRPYSNFVCAKFE